MKAHTITREDELLRRGIALLMDKLGAVEATRFLNLPAEQRLESVTRHRQWQATLDTALFFDDVFAPKDQG